ncbi:unnamed protein product [Rotaria socialis]
MIANDLMAFNEHVPKVNLMESILITDDSFCELYSAVWVDKKDLIVKKFKNNISNLQTLEVHYHRKFTQLDCSHFLPLLYRYENEDHSLYLMALSETTPTLSEDVVPKYSRTQSTRKSNNMRQIIEFNRYIKYALEGLANDFLSTYFYFQQDILKKENNETNTLTKKNRVENENNVTQSNIIASQPDHLTANTTSVSDIQPINNNTTTSDIQSIDINSATSKTFTNNTQSVNNNSELALGSTSTNHKIETRSYKPWYSQKFPWLYYQPNVGGFCRLCRNYWKPGTPLFRNMEQKTKGVFASIPFINWKKSTSTTSVTELLEATNDILEKNILKKIQQARVISIMSDEGTDINRHGNLCICIWYCDQTTGEPTETYVSLLHIKNKDAESIFNYIVTDLQQKNIDLTKTRFVAFDGAAVFSGIHNGVAAKFRALFNLAILFIHCRAHALQLAVISAADSIPDICKSLSTLKSLVNFINRSSVRLTLFEDIQNSAEALGLYNILSNEATAFIIHTLQPILDTLAVLSKCIQTKSADFKQLQDFISSTMLRLEELKDYSSIDYIYIIETIKKLSLMSSGIRNSRLSISNAQLTTDEVFKTKILPFIENIINNVQARFEQSTLNLLNCFMIFDMQNMNNNKDYGDEEIRTIQQHYSSDFDESIMYEWKTFRTYLLTQRQGGKLMTQREVCMKLVQDGMLKDIYPQLSLAAEIFLIAPISTATVERDFSTMNRILTKLRNRLTTKHVDQLMRISMEGANTLNEEMKDEIINY